MFKKLKAIFAGLLNSNWFSTDRDIDSSYDDEDDDELDQNRIICGFAERKSGPHGR